MLLSVDHLLGGKGDVDQILAHSAGQDFAQQGQKFFALFRVQHGQRLVKLGDDLPVLIDIAAAYMGNTAAVWPDAPPQLANFFFIHGRKPLS